MSRRTAIALLATGALLLVLGVVLWQQASDEQADDRLAARYEAAALLDEGETQLAAEVDLDPPADRLLPIVAMSAGGLAVLIGGAGLVRD